ncbi:general stress protein [Micromonospora sp. NPDC000668]|uniref:general stress protein n=1 Tax=Micromonospora sp. NPDC000668 TaxID=3364219 RepID=UPI00367FB270
MSLGSYPTYAQAQQVVDCPADHPFEVGTAQIIGSDLRLVEQITGRLTWPRALLSGAASGAWFGVFVGLLLGVLSTIAFVRAMALGLAWGALFGMAFAAAGYALTGGHRDFTSRSATVPSRFEVLVAAGYGDRARTVLEGAAR